MEHFDTTAQETLITDKVKLPPTLEELKEVHFYANQAVGSLFTSDKMKPMHEAVRDYVAILIKKFHNREP